MPETFVWGNYSQELNDKINQFVQQAEQMPGVVTMHEVGSFPIIYMSQRGLRELNTTLDNIRALGVQYHEQYFNIEDMNDFLPKLNQLLLSKDLNQSFTFFQQVKLAASQSWVWHISASRIFAFDDHNNPLLLVSVSVPIQDMKHLPQKAERLQMENRFLKEHVQKFVLLGPREKEVLRWIAQSFSSQEIADKLFISVETVNTHRKNIKKKLRVNTPFELNEYARAFDLI